MNVHFCLLLPRRIIFPVSWEDRATEDFMWAGSGHAASVSLAEQSKMRWKVTDVFGPIDSRDAFLLWWWELNIFGTSSFGKSEINFSLDFFVRGKLRNGVIKFLSYLLIFKSHMISGSAGKGGFENWNTTDNFRKIGSCGIC